MNLLNAAAFCARTAAVLLCAVCVLSCRKQEHVLLSADTASSPRVFLTWESQQTPVFHAPSVPEEDLPPKGAHPFAGIVSHHLLAYSQIDRWFAELAARSGDDITTFIVLSPSHWELSAGDFSLTFGSWRTGTGVVETDAAAETALLEALGKNAYIEDSVFDAEHGVSVLVPFIHRYFPQAKIAAVVYKGEPPLNQPQAQLLTDAVKPLLFKQNFFTRKAERRDDVFVLVSSDFSHHGDFAATEKKDTRSRRFFDEPSADTWIYAGCDNRPGMYALAHLLPLGSQCSVLYHTNSFVLSGMDADDITSYFFAYFW